jgi:hypothetical protein
MKSKWEMLVTRQRTHCHPQWKRAPNWTMYVKNRLKCDNFCVAQLLGFRNYRALRARCIPLILNCFAGVKTWGRLRSRHGTSRTHGPFLARIAGPPTSGWADTTVAHATGRPDRAGFPQTGPGGRSAAGGSGGGGSRYKGGCGGKRDGRDLGRPACRP